MRHPVYARHGLDVILEWAEANVPGILSDFCCFDLGDPFPPHDDLRLCIFWLADPIQQWCQQSYEQAVQLEEWCQTNAVPMINRPSRLAHAGKSAAAHLIRQAGLRTPRMALIEHPDDARRLAEDVGYPIIIREDWGHGLMMERVDNADELRRMEIEKFHRPVAVEWVDVADRQGVCRKYRFQVAGTLGTPQHLQISSHWITRGDGRIKTPQTEAEEIEYLSSHDPNSTLLQNACRSLQLEFVAFDYGYDQSGQPVVWEANPFPHIHFSRGRSRLKYRNFAVHASLLAVLQSYYVHAGVDVPDSLQHGPYERLPRLRNPWRQRYYRFREFVGFVRRRAVRMHRSGPVVEQLTVRPTHIAGSASSSRDAK